MLSRTACSGRPTRISFGNPAAASTSTSTGTASMPISAKVFSLASIGSGARSQRSGVREEASEKIGAISSAFSPQSVDAPWSLTRRLLDDLRRVEVQEDPLEGKFETAVSGVSEDEE